MMPLVGDCTHTIRLNACAGHPLIPLTKPPSASRNSDLLFRWILFEAHMLGFRRGDTCIFSLSATSLALCLRVSKTNFSPFAHVRLSRQMILSAGGAYCRKKITELSYAIPFGGEDARTS